MRGRSFFRLGNRLLYPWLFMVGLGAAQALPLISEAVRHGGVYAAGVLALNTLLVVPVLIAARWLTPFGSVGFGSVLAALLWGACGATLIAAFFNVALLEITAGLIPESSAPLIIAPLVEEGAKLLGLLLIFWSTCARGWGLFDGVTYGALVGMGFVVVENLAYYLSGHLAIGDTSVIAGLDGAILRSWASLAGSHLVRTAIIGACLVYGYAAARSLPRRLLVVAFGLASSLGLHALWNSPFGIDWNPLLYAARNLPGAILLLLILRQASRFETARLMANIRSLPAGLISEEHVADLVGPFRRLFAALERAFMDEEDRLVRERANASRRNLLRAVLEGAPDELIQAEIAVVRATAKTRS